MGAKCCAGQEAKDALTAETGSRPASSPLEEEAVKPAPAPVAAAVATAGTEEFTITIKKTPGGPRLGVDVDLSNGTTLIVDKVNDGLVNEWNKANPKQEVLEKDQVISVNGVSGSAQLLVDVCKKDDTLEMVIQRTTAE
mmetsp:Transcript_3251/g.7456  ORF Transcript_3251/g.7456 Transcript_3251/m.7456 type:complete len:139 (+) Transcript_3251:91-507(+)